MAKNVIGTGVFLKPNNCGNLIIGTTIGIGTLESYIRLHFICLFALKSPLGPGANYKVTYNSQYSADHSKIKTATRSAIIPET